MSWGFKPALVVKKVGFHGGPVELPSWDAASESHCLSCSPFNKPLGKPSNKCLCMTQGKLRAGVHCCRVKYICFRHWRTRGAPRARDGGRNRRAGRDRGIRAGGRGRSAHDRGRLRRLRGGPGAEGSGGRGPLTFKDAKCFCLLNSMD